MGNLLKFVGDTGTNLPPARAALARCNHQVASVFALLERLRAGEEKLTEDLGRVDTGRREFETFVASDAETLVGKLRAGVDWAVGKATGVRTHNAAAVLGGSAIEACVAEVALVKVRAEIEAAEAKLAELRARRETLILDAVRESAAGIFEDYQITIDRLREGMVALAALERFMGVQRLGRTISIVPSFVRESGLPESAVVAGEMEITAALEIWRRFAAALDKDPAASVDLLSFPEANPSEDQNVIYSDLSQIERSIIDLRFAAS